MNPPLWIGLGVAVALNVATAAVYAWDKRAAAKQRGRVSERTLLGLALLGGWPAAWVTMSLVRHKTQKLRFRLPLLAITALWIAGLGALGWWQLRG